MFRISSFYHFLCAIFAAGICCSATATGGVASETIFAYTADDGSVFLSNVAVDQRYKALLTDESGYPELRPPVARQGGLRTLNAKSRYDQLVDQTAANYGVERALLHAVISVESGYNSQAISPKGASGLMQLMPKTATRYGVTDARDPAQNLSGGAQYLRDLLKLFNNDKKLAIAAYNAGENAVARFGNQIPPFRETVAYVPKVLAYYRQYLAGSDR